VFAKTSAKTLIITLALGLFAAPWVANAQTPSAAPNAAAIIQKVQALLDFPAIKNIRPLAAPGRHQGGRIGNHG